MHRPLFLLLAACLAAWPPGLEAEPAEVPEHGHEHGDRPAPTIDLTRTRSSKTEIGGIGEVFGKQTTEIGYQTIESWMEGDVRITVLLGNVELRQEGMLLRADSIVGWNDEAASKAREEAANQAGVKPPSDPVFDEFYAEGFVRLVREFEVLEADQMYFDLLSNTGLVLETTIRTIDSKNKLPLVVRARELRQLDQRRFIAEGAQITTCDFGDPHLQVRVGKVEFERDRSGGKAAFKSVSAEAGSIPFFFLPFYWTRLGQAYPLRSVSYSNSGRLGHVIRTDWGFDIRKTVRDASGELVRDEEGNTKKKKWGDVLFNLDYMTKRGPAAGVDLDYGWENYSGWIDAYYVNDEGAGHHSDLDDRVSDPGSHNRWRLKGFHRHELAPGWRADLEYSGQSDRFFLEEFFEKEFQEGKSQETYAYLRHLHENMGATFFGNFRRNEFQNQNEYHPQLAFHWISEPIANTGVYYTNRSELANVKSRYDDQLDRDSDRIWRFDSYHELSRPFDLGAVQVAPFVAGRYTGFEEDLDRQDGVDRVIGTAGVRAFTQIHRAYDTKWAALGLNGLRHIASLDLRYTNNFESSKDHHELISFDSVDSADAFEELFVELRQRFQTHREGSDAVFEFLDLGISAEYYPDERRDVREANAQNFLYPMAWIPVAPAEDGDFQRRNWSNLFLDATFTPDAPFALRWDMEYNQYGEGVEVDHVFLDVFPSKKLKITFGHNFVEGVTSALSLGVKWQATEKWKIAWEEQYDFERGVFLSSRLGLTRDMHDFQIEVYADLDEGKDDYTVGFMVAPAKKLRGRESFLDSYGYSRGD